MRMRMIDQLLKEYVRGCVDTQLLWRDKLKTPDLTERVARELFDQDVESRLRYFQKTRPVDFAAWREEYLPRAERILAVIRGDGPVTNTSQQEDEQDGTT